MTAPAKTTMHFGAGTPKAMDDRTTRATPVCDHRQPDEPDGESCLRARSASPYTTTRESEQANVSGVSPARAISPQAVRLAHLLAAACLQHTARLAAAEGAPTTFGVSAARRELASHPDGAQLTASARSGLGTPGGGTHVAAGPLGDGGGRASGITFTVHQKPQNGRGSHEAIAD